MHRDHKLGLALGVLIVGFAAALCFPKQTDVDQRLLQLENTAELDADIAALPVHAYTNADLPAAAPPSAEPVPEAATIFGPVARVAGVSEIDLLAGPPAPIAAAIVAEPTPTTAATRTPATIDGSARGSSTRRSSSRRVMPIATPASRTARSMPRPSSVTR